MTEELINRNTLAYSFRDVHAKLASGGRGVQKQSEDGRWFSSYDTCEVKARKDEIMDIIERLEND